MKKLLPILLLLPLFSYSQTIAPRMFKLKGMGAIISTPNASPSNKVTLVNPGDSVLLTALYDSDTWIVKYKGETGYFQEVYIPSDGDYLEYKSKFTKTIESANLAKRKTSLTSKYGVANTKLILTGVVRLGFTKQMVIEAIGKPYKINRTVGGFGVHEQWVYESGEYYYFENGRLTAWQD